MSIAVTAVVHPSPGLRRLQLLYACALLAAAVWLADSAAVALLLAGAGLCAMPGAARTKAHRIDISGVGQIRLAEYWHDGPGARAALLPGAVLWPWLLVLPLRLDDGRVLRLLVLPDSVASGLFRPLAVACRACAEKNL